LYGQPHYILVSVKLLEDVWAKCMELRVLLELRTLSKHETERQKTLKMSSIYGIKVTGY
jgi:hypothetical protein